MQCLFAIFFCEEKREKREKRVISKTLDNINNWVKRKSNIVSLHLFRGIFVDIRLCTWTSEWEVNPSLREWLLPCFSSIPLSSFLLTFRRNGGAKGKNQSAMKLSTFDMLISLEREWEKTCVSTARGSSFVRLEHRLKNTTTWVFLLLLLLLSNRCSDTDHSVSLIDAIIVVKQLDWFDQCHRSIRIKTSSMTQPSHHQDESNRTKRSKIHRIESLDWQSRLISHFRSSINVKKLIFIWSSNKRLPL